MSVAEHTRDAFRTVARGATVLLAAQILYSAALTTRDAFVYEARRLAENVYITNPLCSAPSTELASVSFCRTQGTTLADIFR